MALFGGAAMIAPVSDATLPRSLRWARFRPGRRSRLIVGWVGGFYLAFTYAHWRAHSRWTAFWTTALCHATGNAVTIGAMIVFGEV
jgi:hypothetical protein